MHVVPESLLKVWAIRLFEGTDGVQFQVFWAKNLVDYGALMPCHMFSYYLTDCVIEHSFDIAHEQVHVLRITCI